MFKDLKLEVFISIMISLYNEKDYSKIILFLFFYYISYTNLFFILPYQLKIFVFS
jgi:hypothetical protein